MNFNNKNGEFYPNLGFNYTLFWKNCFHNINDGSLEVLSNKNSVIYWNFIFHHFVGKFTLLLPEVFYGRISISGCKCCGLEQVTKHTILFQRDSTG